mmetsp:Transcript_24901/g.47304  ORF Transcript_24901/g.47304 Transcript_24901/m.47304 type:complete len:239 (+) Transcript_24901:569-1285(+)
MESHPLEKRVSTGSAICAQIPDLNRLVRVQAISIRISQLEVGTIFIVHQFFIGDEESCDLGVAAYSVRSNPNFVRGVLGFPSRNKIFASVSVINARPASRTIHIEKLKSHEVRSLFTDRVSSKIRPRRYNVEIKETLGSLGRRLCRRLRWWHCWGLRRRFSGRLRGRLRWRFSGWLRGRLRRGFSGWFSGWLRRWLCWRFSGRLRWWLRWWLCWWLCWRFSGRLRRGFGGRFSGWLRG